jgi:outer membrane autotransporter protein
MTGFSLSAYSTWYQQSNWYMDSVLTYARNDYDSTRLISFALPLITVNQLARASSGGTDLNASVTFGRDFNKDSLNYGFYGRAMYGRQGYDGYIEQVDPNLPGAGLALRVADRDVSSLSSVLGAKFSVSHSTNWGVFVPQFEIEWQKEYRSDAEAFQAFFVNDPSGTPIIITGEALDDSFFRAGIGFSAVMTRGRSGFLMYEHIFGRDRISQYSLALGFRVEF